MIENVNNFNVLNLSEGFNPCNLHEDNTRLIKFEKFFFSGGEPHIKIQPLWRSRKQEDFLITTRLDSMNDVGMLMVAVDAIKRSAHVSQLVLLAPYFLGARQDRPMVDGEPLTLKVIADLINSMEFNYVIVFDPHSEGVGIAVNNCIVMDNHEYVIMVLETLLPTQTFPEKNPKRFFHLVSPDAGSNKKMKDLCKYISQSPEFDFDLVKCDKTRNTSTGEITGFDVYSDDLKGAKCIIVDDICDGAGTFIGLAKKLKEKGAGDLYLIVSHGIFSKGLDGLKKYFKHIYMTDSVGTFKGDNLNTEQFYPVWDNFLTIIPIRDIG